MDRTSAAIALVCLFAVISCGVLLRDAADASGKPDLVATYEQRFSALRGAVPKGAPQVGYLTDIPAGDLTAQTEFYLLQYAIAPVIVESRADLPWVIGNFRSTEGMTKALEGKGLTLVLDLGQGVALFRK
jgi:hypothetical protein